MIIITAPLETNAAFDKLSPKGYTFTHIYLILAEKFYTDLHTEYKSCKSMACKHTVHMVK